MERIEKIMEKAEKELNEVDSDWSDESTALKGIGYAILTLAMAIVKNKEEKK